MKKPNQVRKQKLHITRGFWNIRCPQKQNTSKMVITYTKTSNPTQFMTMLIKPYTESISKGKVISKQKQKGIKKIYHTTYSSIVQHSTKILVKCTPREDRDRYR